jgi:hypothetical protein
MYKFAGLSADPPRKLSIRTEFESAFIREFDQFGDDILAVANLWNHRVQMPFVTKDELVATPDSVNQLFDKLNFGIRGMLQNSVPTYRKFTTKLPPYEERREAVQELTKSISVDRNGLLNHLPGLLGQMLVLLRPQSKLELERYHGQSELLTGKGEVLRTGYDEIAPFVVHSEKGGQQVVLLANSAQTLRLIGKDLPTEKDGYFIIFVALKDEQVPKSIKTVKYFDPATFHQSADGIIDRALKFLSETHTS